jgi:hypothetical protein
VAGDRHHEPQFVIHDGALDQSYGGRLDPFQCLRVPEVAMGSEDVRVELGRDGFDRNGFEIRIETCVESLTSSLMLDAAFASSL